MILTICNETFLPPSHCPHCLCPIQDVLKHRANHLISFYKNLQPLLISHQGSLQSSKTWFPLRSFHFVECLFTWNVFRPNQTTCCYTSSSTPCTSAHPIHRPTEAPHGKLPCKNFTRPPRPDHMLPPLGSLPGDPAVWDCSLPLCICVCISLYHCLPPAPL